MREERMSREVVFTIEIISGRGITKPVSEYLQTIQLHCLFEGNIARSERVEFENDEPVFNFSADFNLEMTDADALPSEEKPVLVYITTSHAAQNDAIPVGTDSTSSMLALAIIDFRHALQYSNDFISVELLSCEPDSIQLGISAGVLFARLSIQQLELFASPSEETTNEKINKAITDYQDKLSTESRAMYSQAKKWWSRAMKSNPHLKNRLNKGLRLLALDESGQMRLVCHFIHPITPPREINGPRFAARFASLIPYQKDLRCAE